MGYNKSIHNKPRAMMDVASAVTSTAAYENVSSPI
jgi:hypothetical protein